MLHNYLLFSILVIAQGPACAGGITLELNVPECNHASVKKQANCIDIQNLRKPHRKRKSLIVQGEFGKIIDVVRKIMLFKIDLPTKNGTVFGGHSTLRYGLASPPSPSIPPPTIQTT